ncbi:hypothetical protein [Gaiella sp.]|uniref:hypothetical protein n=1 Tax=Gaiella sp. TaxID=2663207 RepID=UPI002E2F75A4|nr:hypothetical protein [Gaiella sp.]HEX5585185.1 hypothetical protein [Gaiella sp.]
MSRIGVASLVVLAVLIGTAAAAAPDRRPPRIVAGAMLDRDRDQRSDGMRLTYSERVRHRVDRDGRYPFTLRGYRIQSVAAARGRTLLLTLEEKPRVDAGTRPRLRYRRTQAKPVLDRAGNQAVGQRFRGVRALKRVPVVVPPPAPPPPPPDKTAPPDLDPDRDGYVAPLDCKPSDPAIHPGAEDPPDLDFADTNCDGIDGDEAKAVFVSPQGNDASPGTKDRPKRQIQAAVTAAALTGRYVIAATGGYGGIVTASGVDVYGGYDQKGWGRPSEGETEIVGSPEGLLAVGAQNVTLQLLSIRGVASGESAYGVRAVNGSSLRLQRVSLTAGNGAAGAAGAAGAPGRPGGAGLTGAKGACDSNVKAPGGAGGESVVGRYGGKGGDGKYEGDGGDGEPGVVGTPGGKGGDEHGSEYNIDSGEAGSNGSNGAAGAPGAGGTSATVLAGVSWRGQGGREGIYGGPGNGGGGGGAGGGQDGYFVINGTGNGGGGGGGGGEGGRGGGGGLAGGGSFGIYLLDSSLILEESSIGAGNGGAGGRGGNGGSGGAGGVGGEGFYYCTDEVGFGGRGGRGGNGGPGGGGGGGAGGPSVGILKLGTATAKLTETKVAFGTGGAAGVGGGGAPAQVGFAQAVYPS